MGVLNTNFVLTAVSFALVEDVVITTVNPGSGSGYGEGGYGDGGYGGGGAGAGVSAGMQEVTPGSMVGIYIGALLVVGGTDPEVITVLDTTDTTFTANFQFSHDAGDPLLGATFPHGQPTDPLFTQAEMLGYFADVQNDFLLKVRPIYAVGSVDIKENKRIYSQPTDAIRMERVAIAGNELWNESQADMDFANSAWQGSILDPTPTRWYQDKLGPGLFGTGRGVPQVESTAKVFYSQKAPNTATLLDLLFVGDLFFPALKYGILARAWSKDGEQRSDILAKFAQTAYDRWVMAASKFMDGLQARMGLESGTVEPLTEVKA